MAIAMFGCTFSGVPGEQASLDAGTVVDASASDASASDASDASVVPFVVEAENFDRYTPGLNTRFEILTSQAGFKGTGYVEAMREPKKGGKCDARNPKDMCATIEFDFEVTQAQILFLSLQAYTADKDSNSLSWEIRSREGAPAPVYKDKDGKELKKLPLHLAIPDYKPEWQSYTKGDNVTLGIGRYTLALFVREPGFKLDQLKIGMTPL